MKGSKPHERKGVIAEVFEEYRSKLIARTPTANYHARPEGKRWVLTITRERGPDERHEFDDEASLRAFIRKLG